MGYRVRSALTIGHGEGQASFLYFVPARGTQHRWVTDWIEQHFNIIAEEFGSSAVFIAPFVASQDAFRKSLNEALDWGALETGIPDDVPALVVSRHPLGVGDPAEAVVIDVRRMRSKDDLAWFVDRVIRQVQTGEDLVRQLPGILFAFPEYRSARSPWNSLGFFELKPNVGGIGININAIIDWYRTRRERDR